MKIKNLRIATFSALAAMSLSGFFIDIYLPSMPLMATELGCSPLQVQLTVTLFLVCYALSQIFIGGLLDAWGRYKLTLYSLLFLMISSIILGFLSSIYLIYFFRALQGLCAGVAASAKRSFFVDVYSGDQRKHYLSLLSVAWSLGPIVAPFIGGYLGVLLGWRADFFFMALLTTSLLAIELLFSGETIVHRHSLKINEMIKNYFDVVKTADFRYGLILLSSGYGTIFVFTLSGAFIIENTMGYSAVVAGNISLISGIAWMCGGLLGRFLIRYDLGRKIKLAFLCLFFLILTMLLASLIHQNIVLLTAFMFLIHTIVGFIFNNFFAYCIGRFPQKAAVAGGITSGGNSFLTAVISYGAVKLLNIHDTFSLSFGYAFMAILGCLSFIFFLRAFRALHEDSFAGDRSPSRERHHSFP